MSATSPPPTLPTRTSCEQCRTRKLKCNGTPPAMGGCERCKKDKVQCVYTVRAPIGRPKGALSGSGSAGGMPVARKKRKLGGIVDSARANTSTSPPGQMAPSPPSSSSSSSYGHSRSGSGAVAAYGAAAATTQGSPLTATTIPPTPTGNPPTQPLPPMPYNVPANYALPYTSSLNMTQQSTLPSSLATLEMAAFLDSLDRVEIRSSDGLTGDMLPSYSWPGADTAASTSTFTPFAASTPLPPPPPPSVPVPAWGGTILDEGVSYAVPSDFSWWDVGLDADFMSGSGGKGVNSATEESIDATPTHSASHSSSMDSTAATTTTTTTASTTPSGPLDVTARRATSPHSPGLDHKWPRGPENGMGQGLITTQEGHVVTGGPWPVGERAASVPKDTVTTTKTKTKTTPACCASKTKEIVTSAPSCTAKDDGGEDEDDDDAATAATAATAAAAALPSPCPRTGNPSCCCESEQIAQITAPAAPPATSCCSKKEPSEVKLSEQRDTPPAASTHSSPRVHCVPNPSGTGCTCLCESEVCLLGVRRTLSTSPERTTTGEIPSLHLTLSASQAISASCACSSTCPTCRFHPSSSAFNASLLISLSLQIYARAVRILRDGFSDGNGLEIKIGGYTPRKENAKKIALLAMRLELTDLERGMARVWSVAVGQTMNTTTTSMEDEATRRLQDVVGGGGGASAKEALGNVVVGGGSPLGDTLDGSPHRPNRDRRLAPIDRIVIRKLREQLKEMILRVEALENS